MSSKETVEKIASLNKKRFRITEHLKGDDIGGNGFPAHILKNYMISFEFIYGAHWYQVFGVGETLEEAYDKLLNNEGFKRKLKQLEIDILEVLM